jgi:hypothetical protein
MTGSGRAGDDPGGASTGHGRTGEYLDGALRPEDEAAFLDHLAGCAACQAELHDEVQLRDREDALRGRGSSSGCHGRAGEYLDGALEPEDEAAFLDHLAGCAACQAELHDEVQLRDREHALRRAAIVPLVHRTPVPDAGPSKPSGGRRPGSNGRLAAWGSGIAALAAAAAVFVVWPRGTRQPIALAPGPTRLVEIRLSHPAAAGYRPYDTPRGSATVGEPIAPSLIAELDRAGDCQGVAAAYVLSGELVRAADRYSHCAAGPDLDADRAGLAVLRGELDAALDLTEAVLDAVPDHTVALWTRGLELSAAAAFDRVVEREVLRAPGWANEAAYRAAVGRSEIARMRAASEEVNRRGLKMIQGGPPLPAALAQQVPWRSRVHLHDAIRTATDPARLDQLVPLATALEGRAGSDLGRYVTQARAQLSPGRAAAVPGYREIVEKWGAVDDRTWTRWLALATRARTDDLILGARIATRRLDGDPSAEQLAAATHDPWFELGVAVARSHAALDAGRVEEAAARLTALEAQCPPGAASYRCLQAAVELTRLANDRHQPTEARRHALEVLAMSRELGEWAQRAQGLVFAADAERFGGAFGSARAYYEESALSLEACGVRNSAFTTAEMLFQRHHLPQARALAAAAPACGRPPTALELTLLARLQRAGYPVLAPAAVAARIGDAQRAAEHAGEGPYLEFLAAWLALDDDPAARDRLVEIAGRARGLEGAMRDKTLSAIDNARFADAGRRAAWGDALAVAAAANGVTAPTRCALAFGADELRFTAVAVGPDGTVAGDYEPDRARSAGWLAPEPMRRRLSGCDEVAVLALPPWLGVGPVLGTDTPWHYVLGPPPPPPAGRPRHVVVAAPVPPPEAGLAPLAPRTWPATDELITGAAATPERVLTAISDATLIEIHSHATWLDPLDAPVLALSPGANGWALGAARIRSARLTGAPLVVLADCAGGAAARFEHQAWGLPLAFRRAGARAVIASLAAIPDRDAGAFFDAVTAELARGASPATAVARVRAEKMRGDPTSWMREVVVFQ